MTRAYLRLDTGFFERKLEQGYPPAAIGAFVACLCLAESQPKRGRFRDEAVLRALLTPAYAKWLPFLLEHQDLIPEGSRLYMDGWDEWQEGDVTVPERMVRLRNRKNGTTPADTVPVTPSDTVAVTVPVTTPRQTEPVEAEAVSISKSNGGPPYNGAPSTTFMGFKPKKPMDPRIDLADIDRQQSASLEDAIRKTAEREAGK